MQKLLEELTAFSENFLENEYDMKLNIPIGVNNRLTRSLGSYYAARVGNDIVPSKIDLSGKLLRYATKNVIIKVLKHELIHYALHSLGKPYKDGDLFFENEIRKHNSITTESLKVGEYNILSCKNCGSEWESTTKRVVNNIHEYRSGCCETSIKYLGTRIYNGEKEVKKTKK